MPPVGVDFARAWETKASSDVTLLIYPYHETGDGGKPEPVAKVPLHVIIVSSITPYFETQLHGACQGMGSEPENEPEPASGASGSQKRPGAKRKPAAKRAKTTLAPRASGKVLELTCFGGEPHTVPEAVMRHAYTGILPDEPEVLAWVMRRADYMGMHGTVEACTAKLQQLSDGGQLTVQHVVAISSLPGLSTLDEKYRAAVEQAVASMAAKVLAAQLGVAHRVVTNQQLLDQFVQLPFQLLKQWAMLDSLQVDSENTMAVLITAWYDHQLDSATPVTEQQCKELSALICLDKLTLCFHLQALPHLKWYRAPADAAGQHAVARALQATVTDCQMLPSVSTALASGGVAGRKQGPAKAEKKWSLSRQQLENLWKDKYLLLEGTTYMAGFSFLTDLICTKVPVPEQPGPPGQSPGQYTLGLYVGVRWPEVLVKHGVNSSIPYPTTAVHAKFKVGASVSDPGPLIVGIVPGKSVGCPDVAEDSVFSSARDVVSFMATRPCVSITLKAC